MLIFTAYVYYSLLFHIKANVYKLWLITKCARYPHNVRCVVPVKLCNCHAGFTLSPSAFGEILERALHEMRLHECDSLHSCRELFILAHNRMQQPGETQDHLTRTSQTTKKVRTNEARNECPRLHKIIRGKEGECFHLHSLPWIFSVRVYSWHHV